MKIYKLTYEKRFPVYQDRGITAPGPRFVGEPKWHYSTWNWEFEAENDQTAAIKAKEYLKKLRENDNIEFERLEEVEIVGENIIRVPVQKIRFTPIN